MMNKVFAIAVACVVLLGGVAFADITYEKVDDKTMKQIASAEQQFTRYQVVTEKARLQARITDLDAVLAEMDSLGVTDATQ
jgi:hypothetical protein